MSPFVSGALGALTVLLLAGLVRRAAWRRRLHARRAGPGGSPWFLRRLFRRLGTRPEQEKVVSGEADALAEELRALREEGRALRAELAGLLEGPALEARAVAHALEGRMERLAALRGRLAEALARVHTVLDPPQRTQLAAILRSGHRGPQARCA